MRTRSVILLGYMLVAVLGMTGCFGKGDGDAPPTAPVPTVDLAGTLTLPAAINSSLMASVNQVSNTDTTTGRAWSAPAVAVNDQAVTTFSLATSTVSAAWEFHLQQVPQAANGWYKIEVNVKKVGLKAWVREADRSAFTIDSRTTAAALLAQSSGLTADVLLATFPAAVGLVARQLEKAWMTDSDLVPGTIFDLASVTAEVASQADFLKNNTGFDPAAMVAYLGLANDLDGDGVTDLQIATNDNLTAIRFYTALSASTSLKSGLASISEYTGDQLLADFAAGNVSQESYFNATKKDFALGCFFKRSVAGDQYVKLFVKRIDLVSGDFRGVVAEYQFVTATSTAVATGTKTFLASGAAPVEGAVLASDFLTDGAPGTGTLSLASLTTGLGSTAGSAHMVRAYDGTPDLATKYFADPYRIGDPLYAANMSAARVALGMTAAPQVGDVFAVFFPVTGHYALIKIKEITAATITVDYKVNRVPGENKF